MAQYVSSEKGMPKFPFYILQNATKNVLFLDVASPMTFLRILRQRPTICTFLNYLSSLILLPYQTLQH